MHGYEKHDGVTNQDKDKKKDRINTPAREKEGLLI